MEFPGSEFMGAEAGGILLLRLRAIDCGQPVSKDTYDYGTAASLSGVLSIFPSAPGEECESAEQGALIAGPKSEFRTLPTWAGDRKTASSLPG